MDYIILNGVNITLRYGVIVTKLPPITTPGVKTQVTEIEGRSGEDITFLGYTAYDKTFSIRLSRPHVSDELSALFTGEGTVTFSNEPNKYYKYYITSPVVFEGETTITMRVQPFKYSLIDGVRTFDFKEKLLKIPRYVNTKQGIHVNVAGSKIEIKGEGQDPTEWYIPVRTLELAPSMYKLDIWSKDILISYVKVGLVRDSKDIEIFGGELQSVNDWDSVTQKAWLPEPTAYNFLYLYIPGGVDFECSLTIDFQSEASRTVTINNWGNVISRPKMTVFGEGDINIDLNNAELFNINLKDEKYITIDADKMDAYKGDVLKNRLVRGDYADFVLEPGANTLTATGAVGRIDIENFSTWI